MKWVILVAVLAVTSVTSRANTCFDFDFCITRHTPKDLKDKDEVCRAGRKVLDCMDNSLADCKKKDEAQSKIDRKQQTMEGARDQFEDTCGSSMAKMSIAALLLSVIVAITM